LRLAVLPFLEVVRLLLDDKRIVDEKKWVASSVAGEKTRRDDALLGVAQAVSLTTRQ
jgi:hypothetical protein